VIEEAPKAEKFLPKIARKAKHVFKRRTKYVY
jgi:hypothetical protein